MKEELIGKNVSVLMPESVAKLHDGYMRKYSECHVRHMVGATTRVNAKRKNGAIIPVQLSVEEIVDGDGNPVFVASLRSMSTELQLERQQLVNRAAIDLSSDPIIATDFSGTVLAVNQAAQATWGLH